MAKQGTLLVVDDNRNILTSLQYLLEEYFQQVITLNSPVTIPSLLQREERKAGLTTDGKIEYVLGKFLRHPSATTVG